MTITIDLPPKTIEALQADAGVQGRPAEQVAAEYLTALFAEDDAEEEAAALNTALDELEAGKGRPFAEFSRELSDGQHSSCTQCRPKADHADGGQAD